MKQYKRERIALAIRPNIPDKILFILGLIIVIFILYINYLVTLKEWS